MNVASDVGYLGFRFGITNLVGLVCKYIYPVKLVVYSQTVEVTIYLTFPLKLSSYNHQH
jgi:hypothetical protein